jgi:hypothetical protein
MIGLLLSTKMATLRDLYTCYSIEDAYDMMEIVLVDATNKEAAEEHARRTAGRT